MATRRTVNPLIQVRALVLELASVAQQAEQPLCKWQVVSSIPTTGSN